MCRRSMLILFQKTVTMMGATGSVGESAAPARAIPPRAQSRVERVPPLAEESKKDLPVLGGGRLLHVRWVGLHLEGTLVEGDPPLGEVRHLGDHTRTLQGAAHALVLADLAPDLAPEVRVGRAELQMIVAHDHHRGIDRAALLVGAVALLVAETMGRKAALRTPRALAKDQMIGEGKATGTIAVMVRSGAGGHHRHQGQIILALGMAGEASLVDIQHETSRGGVQMPLQDHESGMVGLRGLYQGSESARSGAGRVMDDQHSMAGAVRMIVGRHVELASIAAQVKQGDQGLCEAGRRMRIRAGILVATQEKGAQERGEGL